jgi:hypothetical protein
VTVEFGTTPIAFTDALGELVAWPGQDLHVEVSIAGGAGVCGFDTRFEGLAADEEEGSVVLRFEGDVAVVALSEVMSAFTISSPTMEARGLRFTVGDHQSIEVGRAEPAEIRRRTEGVGPDA